MRLHEPQSGRAEASSRAPALGPRKGFWSPGVTTFVDVTILNPLAPSYRHKSTTSLLRNAENEKKNKYAARIIQVEKGTFTPLVFSTLGGCGVEASCFIKRLIDLLSTKTRCTQSKTASFVRTKISFSIVKSTVLCVRGTRGARIEQNTIDVDLECAKAQI